MARILLVNPPFYRLLGSHYNGLSLGLAYIASSLEAAGHEAWILNADFVDKPTYKTLHQIFETFRGFDEAPIAQCVEDILDFQPDVVGYSCYTATVPVIQKITSAIRQADKLITQIVGGPHVTLDDKASERFPQADYVVQGEGEHVMQHVADHEPMSRTIHAARIRELDALPFPMRRSFWKSTGRDVAYLSTARGCPFRCSYCGSPAIWPRVHARSPENVIEEIHTIPRECTDSSVVGSELAIADNSCLYIIDDTFTFNERRAIQIMRGINRLWKCEARADTITEAIATEMAASGCARVKMGVESGSPSILKAINKGETLEDMRGAVERLHRHGVKVTVYLMAGFPGETDDDLRQTIRFARELQADYYSISMVAPYFGTKLYHDAVAAGVPVDKAPWQVFFHHNDSLLLNPNLSRELIEELWSLCDVRNYV